MHLGQKVAAARKYWGMARQQITALAAVTMWALASNAAVARTKAPTHSPQRGHTAAAAPHKAATKIPAEKKNAAPHISTGKKKPQPTPAKQHVEKKAAASPTHQEKTKTAAIAPTALAVPPTSHIEYGPNFAKQAELIKANKLRGIPAKNPDGVILKPLHADIELTARVCKAEGKGSLGTLGEELCAETAKTRLAIGSFGKTLREVLLTGGYNVIRDYGGIDKLPKASKADIDRVYGIIDGKSFGGVIFFKNGSHIKKNPTYMLSVVSNTNPKAHHEFSNGFGNEVYLVPKNVKIVVPDRPENTYSFATKSQAAHSKS